MYDLIIIFFTTFLSSRGVKCKTFCKMCSCKNSAKILQIFFQLYCNFFATFLQFFFKIFVNWFGIRTKGTHFWVTSRRGCWMIDSWPLVLSFFWKIFADFCKKCTKKLKKKLQENCKKIEKKLQKSCKKFAKCEKNFFSSV